MGVPDIHHGWYGRLATAWGSVTGTLADQTDLQSAIDGKQTALVSGTNIKTVNGNTLLGSGDVSISASVAWGGITGTLASQTDLQSALDAKQASGSYATGAQGALADSAVQPGDLATVATTGAYSDLTALPSLFSGAYGDLSGVPATFTPSAHTHALSDLTASGATSGQVATWNGSAWAPATPSGGGGAGQLVHTYVVDESTLIDTNSPAARRFFLNTHRYVMLLDLTDFTECRLLVNKQGVAGAASYKLCMEYRAAGFSTYLADYSDIGTSEVACACNVTYAIVTSGWIDLVAGAKADVAVCVTSEGGDGVLDPQFGSIVLQFR